MQQPMRRYRGESTPCAGARALREHEWRRVAKSFGLTDRELDILRLCFEELVEAEIAIQLGISRHTVRSHRRHLYGKVGACNRASLILRVCLRVRALNRERFRYRIRKSASRQES